MLMPLLSASYAVDAYYINHLFYIDFDFQGEKHVAFAERRRMLVFSMGRATWSQEHPELCKGVDDD